MLEDIIKLGLKPNFFDMYKLTFGPVAFIVAWTVQEFGKASFSALLLAVVRMTDDEYMVVRAARERHGGHWVNLENLDKVHSYTTANAAIATLSELERNSLGLKTTLPVFKCAWCELIFDDGDLHHAIMVRISNKMSIDETLCDDCTKYLYEKIQPIMEGRIQRQKPHKGRNIII